MSVRVGIVSMACVLLAGVGRAGSETTDPAMVRVSHAQWTFAPAFSGERAVAFLAWDEAAEEHPGNLTLMLFIRANDDQWASYAWESGDVGGAVIAARGMMNDASAFSGDGFLSEAAAHATALDWPSEVTQGMLAEDPLVELVQGMQGDQEAAEFVEALAEIGWPVGMSLSAELAIGIIFCEDDETEIDVQNDLLLDTARKAELAAFGTSATAATAACGQWCSCTTTYTGWTVATPNVWTLTGSLTTGSSKTCYYSHAATYTWTNSGRWWYCPSCAGTGTGTGTETGSATVLAGEPCPAGPTGGTTFNP